MKKSLHLLISIFFTATFSFAQSSYFPGSLYVLNEGSATQMGSVGVVNGNGSYEHIDSLKAYGNQVLYDAGEIFVVDGDGIVKLYDASTKLLKQKIEGAKARSVAVYKDKVLVTGTSIDYAFAVYSRSDFLLEYSIKQPNIRSAREQVFVSGDKAYLSGYYGDSVVYIVDLLTQSLSSEIKTVPNPVKIDQIDNVVYVASYEYSGFSTITHVTYLDYDTNDILQTQVIPDASSMTASNDKLYFVLGGSDILKFDPNTLQKDTLVYNSSFYNISFDVPSNYLFFTQTDYVSTGEIGYILNNGPLSQKVSTHISPRSVSFNFAFGVDIDTENAAFYTVFPNPAQGVLNVQLKGEAKEATMELLDMSGKVLKTKQVSDVLSQMSLENIAAGIYFVRLTHNGKSYTEKISVR